jgi:hypothetical protein
MSSCSVDMTYRRSYVTHADDQAMSRTRLPTQSSPDVQQWVDNIPLAALERSDHEGEPLRTSTGSHHDNELLSLTPSQHRSLDRDQSHIGSGNVADTTTHVLEEPLRSPVSATISSPSDSRQSIAADDRHTSRNSGTLPSNDSLLQLLAVDIPLGAQFRLPSSRTGSLESGSNEPTAQNIINSLEELERLQPLAPSEIPLPAAPNLSLPYSSEGSSESGSGVGGTYVVPDSLEQLQRLHPPFPSAVSLPESTETADLEEEDASGTRSYVRPPRTSRRVRRDYWQRSEPLTQLMPQLKSIFPPSGRHEYTGKVTCIDYFSDSAEWESGDEINVSRMMSQTDEDTLSRQLRALRTVENLAVSSRLILVEDLCSKSIEILGAAFRLDPEFFAEHLNRSGYDVEDYSVADSARWNTAHLDKDYTTLTWCRPVYQNPLLTDWLRAPRKLLNKEKGRNDGSSSVTWCDPKITAEGKENRHAHEHRLRVETNVFRQSWSLSAGPAAVDGQLRATGHETLDDIRTKLIPTAWQERASYCTCWGDDDIPIGMSSASLRIL